MKAMADRIGFGGFKRFNTGINGSNGRSEIFHWAFSITPRGSDTGTAFAAGKSSRTLVPETVLVQGGTFKMGTQYLSEEPGKEKTIVGIFSDEAPVREVTISDFRGGVFDVTNEEYMNFLNVNGLKISKDRVYIVQSGDAGERPGVSIEQWIQCRGSPTCRHVPA